MKRRIIAWIVTLSTVLFLLPLVANATGNNAEAPCVPAKPYKITNVVSGVHVYWKAVSGAEKYGLWRSETGINGTYKWIANPTTTHFTDTNVTSGKAYHYKISAVNPTTGEHTDKSDPISTVFVSTPDITARYNKAAGIKLEWQKITGATGYAVYRKSYSGTDAWVRVMTITSGSTTSWIDESVKNNNGTVYRYTVRALAGTNSTILSGCRNNGRTMVRLCSQVMTSSAKASDTSIKCSWTTSKAVTGYEVRFVVDGSVYKTYTIGNYATGTKTFTGLEAGQTYQIQVRTYKTVSGVGSFYSAWSEAKYVELESIIIPGTHVCSYTATKRMSAVAKSLYDQGEYDYTEYGQYEDWDVDVCEGCGYPDMATLRFAYTPMEAAEIMVGYVNELRESVYGTSEYNLIVDEELVRYAEIRAEELDTYYGHGGTNTGATAENIVGGGPNIYDHFLSWKNSEGHYNAMVNPDNLLFGYAVYQSSTGYNIYGVQLFL